MDQERGALIATFRELGPDAPTLCAGWDTRTLLAHLIRRERSVLELGARLRLPIVTAKAEAAMDRYAEEHSFEDMLTTFGSGSPRYSIFAVPALAEPINLLEYVIHHEDCRRPAGLEPRPLSAEFNQHVLKRLRPFAKLTMRKSPVGVSLEPSGERPIRVGKGATEPVVVAGQPVELALVATGRQAAAVVDYSGDPDAVAALTAAKFGV
ncbi:MAG: hypothetical protein JWO63_686 [Frankiales bacterium]|nr:hypothetical protein [Frankiales bacterium]